MARTKRARKPKQDPLQKLANEQCPNGFHMVIRSQDEWTAIAAAVNQGIDSHLEALTDRSSFDSSSGVCLVHPDELHVLVRRLEELDADKLFPDWDYEVENDPATSLAQDIRYVLEHPDC